MEDGLKDCGEKLSSDIFQPLMLTAADPALYSSTVSLFDEVTSLIRTLWYPAGSAAAAGCAASIPVKTSPENVKDAAHTEARPIRE